MKLLWQALRATTVETFGVVLLVWTLLEVPALSYRTIAHSLEARGGGRPVATQRASAAGRDSRSAASAPWSLVSCQFGPFSVVRGQLSLDSQ